MDETGAFERVDRMRENMRINYEILNDPTLTNQEKIKKLTNRNRSKKRT